MSSKKRKPQAQSDTESVVSHENTINDTDEGSHEVEFKTHSSHYGDVQALYRFLDDPMMINQKGDPTTNIFDVMGKKSYNIPNHKLPRFFELYNRCRAVPNLRLTFAEKQLDYSGIMLDFDIYQLSSSSQMTPVIFQFLLEHVVKQLLHIIVPPTSNFVVTVGIFQRRSIKFCEDKTCEDNPVYKDGMHILIPGLQVKKQVKKILIQRLKEQEILDQVFRDVEPVTVLNGKPYGRVDYLDVNSASVPVFLAGSASKAGNQPYNLSHIYEAHVHSSSGNSSDHITVIESKLIKTYKKDTELKFNVAYEFSLNYKSDECKIQKQHFLPNVKYADTVNKPELETKQDEEFNNFYGMLSTNSVHDANMNEVRKLLQLLNKRRSDEYNDWFAVLCALAHTSPSYKILAEEFSRRSTSFNPISFENTWNQALRNSRTSHLTIASVYYWAKVDNASAYENVIKESISHILSRIIYEPCNKGKMGHYDVAKILHLLLKNKFVNDIPEDDAHKRWYEFILDEDEAIDGEIYKWRMCQSNDKIPASLSRYISEVLPKLFTQQWMKIKEQVNKSTDETSKYFKEVQKNFEASMHQLKNAPYKRSVMSEAECLFNKFGFARTLDMDPFIRGVSNGILKLGQTAGSIPKLIKGYHNYRVSKYMPTPYIPFNPADPQTKDILIALRNLFPDNESDTFDYFMYYLASTIDANDKESIFAFVVGGGCNGKSFLMEMHKNVLGDYGVKQKISLLTDMHGRLGAADPDIMKLRYATFAYYSESNPGDIINLARVKELTSMESIAARALFKNTINFRPKCHHMCISNNEFTITSNDYGTWRRIVFIPLKITFVLDENKYDPSIPNHRKANKDIVGSWINNSEIRGRYLGILVWYHHKLYRKYAGKVQHVPHKHIAYDTLQYRKRQDVMAQFIAMKLVVTTDTYEAYPLHKECEKFIKWYSIQFPQNPPPKHVMDMIRSSELNDYIVQKDRVGPVIIGRRFVDDNNPIREGEKYLYESLDSETDCKNNFDVPVENSEQFYARICAEYEDYKEIFSKEATYDVDKDAINLLSDETKTYVDEGLTIEQRISRQKKFDLSKVAVNDSELVSSTKKVYKSSSYIQDTCEDDANNFENHEENAKIWNDMINDLKEFAS
jgi:hypothetical protein